MPIIKLKKSIIPSCDVDSLEKLKRLVSETCDVSGVGAYKVGFELVIPFGSDEVVKTIRNLTNLPIIYDHQKAGTDIPDTGYRFMEACRLFDAVIIFPQAGPVTERAWIGASQKEKMGLIVGGEMTHKGYLRSDGGYLEDSAPKKIYAIAAELGITDFVIPGNKPEKALQYAKLINAKVKNAVFYSPGLITQGGNIGELARNLDSWHAIVGRAIYEAGNIKKSTEELVKNL
jgi:orotidine-5'-phosphate decarboxylase